MTNFADIVFPNQPMVGVANIVPQPVPPVVSVSTPEVVVSNPEIGIRTKVLNTQPNPVAARGNLLGIPVNPPAIGIPAHTPLLTPIGVYPQFEPHTLDGSFTENYGGGQ